MDGPVCCNNINKKKIRKGNWGRTTAHRASHIDTNEVLSEVNTV